MPSEASVISRTTSAMRMLRPAMTTESFSGHLRGLAFAADTGGIDEGVDGAFVLEFHVDGIARVVPAIGETMARSSPVRALSSVDLPTFGRPMMAMRMRLGSGFCSSRSGFFLGFLREACGHVREQLLHAETVFGGDGEHVANAEAMEIMQQRFLRANVDLVDGERDGFAGLAEHCARLRDREPESSVRPSTTKMMC
jgi:hypothetical protein